MVSDSGRVAEGRLIGGNVNAMYGFIGTPYFPEIVEGDILLVEDCLKMLLLLKRILQC